MKNTALNGKLLLGTCSWNYDSWVGLLYTSAQPTAAAYLPEYSRSLPTAEVDSWFYRLPSPSDVRTYLSAVPESFRFTCKVLQDITLTHHRSLKGGKQPPRPNENFLSASRFESFLGAIEPLLPRLDAIMFEFEYLNKQKMPSLEAFLERLDGFFAKLPPGLPYALEPRNGNYLKDEYFAFLNSRRIIHVYSEKIYMPHVYDVFDEAPRPVGPHRGSAPPRGGQEGDRESHGRAVGQGRLPEGRQGQDREDERRPRPPRENGDNQREQPLRGLRARDDRGTQAPFPCTRDNGLNKASRVPRSS